MGIHCGRGQAVYTQRVANRNIWICSDSCGHLTHLTSVVHGLPKKRMHAWALVSLFIALASIPVHLPCSLPVNAPAPCTPPSPPPDRFYPFTYAALHNIHGE